jgi:CheY-like chemotaxis protein
MGRVLLVEDHDGVHGVLCSLIEETGHEAECVTTKQEALARLTPASHHLVIADVRLPDGLGHAVAERAAELGIKAVLMTGHPDELHSLSVSEIMHLAKPFSISDLYRVIGGHLGSPLG